MKKLKIFIFAVSLMILMMLLGYKVYNEKTTVFGVNKISEQELLGFKNSRVEFEGYVDLYYKDIKIPYMNDSSNYIFPQNYNDEYHGVITCDFYSILYVDEGYSKSEYMKMNKPLKFIIYNDDVYKEVFVTLTNLPIITLDTIKGTKDENEIRSIFRIIEANPEGRDSIVVETKCEANYHIRGGTSKLFPKKSYKLNLLNNKDKKIEKSLLEMREDDDWILNSMYIDDSKVREKLAYDLWNLFQNIYEPNMQYVELIIDQEYIGLYLLQVPYDYKYFGLDEKNDYLYKIKKYRENFDERNLYSDSILTEKNERIDEFKIKKYQTIDYNKAVEILRDITYDAVKEKEQILNINEIKTNIIYDIESYADYNLFTNMILAADNSYKNQLLIAHNKQNDVIVKKYIWDIDYSFLEDFYGLQTINNICIDNFIPSQVLYSDEYVSRQKERYKQVRQSFYQTQYISELLNNNLNEIIEGGSIVREYQKWDISGFDQDVKVINDFIDSRISILDEYYNYND